MNKPNYFHVVASLLVGLAITVLSNLQAEEFIAPDLTQPVRIDEFRASEPSLTRAGRTLKIEAYLYNPSENDVQFEANLVAPAGIDVVTKPESTVQLKSDCGLTLNWTITASQPIYAELKLELSTDSKRFAIKRLPVRFLESRKVESVEYIPEPVVPKKTSKILVGVHNCPLWSQGNYNLWSNLGKHPERTPALGFYAQENPEVADWETKWATEHGIDFFIYCWYRTEQGGAVKTMHESAMTDALFNSRFQNRIKITLMWENQVRGRAGVANEQDLYENLFPYWLNTYFKRDNYLKIDNKPVLYIYRPEFLVNDLGSVQNVHKALDKLRDLAKQAGFDGLILLGEYRGSDPQKLKLFKELGLDYMFAYCWYVGHSPNPDEAMASQMAQIRKLDSYKIIPQTVTLSQAWSGWQDEGSLWKLPPEEFEALLRQGKAYVEQQPQDSLAGKMLILDNWNEWSEGHYLAPYTEYGFGYLDAIANVFVDGTPHDNILPADIGKGGYDKAYRDWLVQVRQAAVINPVWKFGVQPTDLSNKTPSTTNIILGTKSTDPTLGWRLMMGLKDFQVVNGKLTATTTNSDPAFMQKFPQGFRAKKYKQARVRIKMTGLNNRPTCFQFYWLHDSDNDWSERCGITQEVISDDQTHDYVFQLSNNPEWSGKIFGLRIDCCNHSGVKCEIEEIVLE